MIDHLNISEDELHAYVDGELAADRRSAVESWLTTHPGQWKLQHPKNLVYETIVHPFAQVYDLAGSIAHADTTVSGRHEIASGQHFFDTWQVSLVCERATGHVFLSHAPYEIHQVLAICEDGLLSAEVERNRFTALDRGRWPPYSEPLHLAGRVALQELRSGVENVVRGVDAALHQLLLLERAEHPAHRGRGHRLAPRQVGQAQRLMHGEGGQDREP